MKLHIAEADLSNARDTSGVLDVLNSYASDPMGGGKPLANDVLSRLPAMLRETPSALVLLAYDEVKPVGVAVCFFALSTFRARPLLNIHDLAILPSHRGMGIGRALLDAAQDRAKRKGCCKLTLEVRDDNTRGRALYRSFGFEDFAPGEMVFTRFLTKSLEA